MRSGLIISFIAHSTLIALGLISLGNVKPLVMDQVESISVDLVPIEEFSNITIGSEQSENIKTDAPSLVDTIEPAQIAQRTGNTQEDQVKPEITENITPAPTVQTAPEPVPAPNPAPDPEPEPTAEPEPTPTELVEPEPVLALEPQVELEPKEIIPAPLIRTASIDKKREEYKKQLEEKAKKRAQELAEKKAKEAKEATRISDIINAEESRGATTGAGGEQSAGKATGQAATLTQTEQNALAASMRKCWNPPISAFSEDGLTVRLLVNLNRNGSVNGTPKILSQINSSVAGATAKAAQRAVMRCSPYALNAQKYDNWKQVDVTFDPNDL